MPTLKKTISRYLVLLAAICIAVMVVMIVFLECSSERRYAYRSSVETLSRIEQLLEENSRDVEKTQEDYRQACLNNAEAIAYIIEGNHKLIHDPPGLKDVAKVVGVDEIHIFDAAGRIISGTTPEYYGYTFDSGEQMKFFKPMLTDKTLRLVQDVTPNTAEGKPMQYAAVWDRKSDHIVQIGMEPDSVRKVTEKNELSYFFSMFWVNPECNYYAIKAATGKIVGSTIQESVGQDSAEFGLSLEKLASPSDGFFSDVNGQRSYCVTRLVAENYLVRVVSEAELYRRIPIVTLLLVLALTVAVVVLCLATAKCTNRFVIDKLREVNDKLYSIAMGNLDEEIDVKDSMEFAELSRYLDIMIKSLLDSNNKISYVFSKVDIYAGVYEYNRSMERVRYTEYLPTLLALENEQMEHIASDYTLFKEHIDKIRSHPVPGRPGVFRLSEGSSQLVRLEEVRDQSEILGVVISASDELLEKKDAK